MKISICNKCRGFNYEEIIKLIKENYELKSIQIGCNNTCGVGRNKIVVIINDVLYSAKTKEELLKKINTI